MTIYIKPGQSQGLVKAGKRQAAAETLIRKNKKRR